MGAGAIHHLNCGTMCPPLVGPRFVCHCLLVETPRGLVLVETGLGTADLEHGGARLPRAFRLIIRPRLDPAETAIARVRALGFDPRDVRDIVVTHLDMDHAGGIGDFPWATVHVHAHELAGARARTTRTEKHRYLGHQFEQHGSWREYGEHGGDDWFGLRALRPLEGLGDDFALVPLLGHTRGHSGVAVRDSGGAWLLHAGDAYFHHLELEDPKGAPLLLRVFQRALDDFDTRARRANQERLRQLARERAGAVRVFCAHDSTELEALERAKRSA